MSEAIITSKNICKDFGSFQALNNVNINVKRGDIYGLIGDNGAGKSTLLKLIAGHSFATSGELLLFGDKHLEKSRKQFGFLIEDPGFFANLSVKQILKYYCIQKGVVDYGKIEDIMETTGIVEKQKTKCKNLSLGQKRRLGLAIALIGDPQVLVLDEPINGLDPSGIIEFRNLLLKLNVEKQITIIVSSHILTELEQVATVYGFLKSGKVIEEISASKLYEKCYSYVELTLADTKKFSVILEQNYDTEKFKVISNDVLRIYNPSFDVKFYTKIAADNEISIINIDVVNTSLEDYYIDLMGGVDYV